jgi:hypothetical protein
MLVYFRLFGFFPALSAFGLEVIDDQKEGQLNQGLHSTCSS